MGGASPPRCIGCFCISCFFLWCSSKDALGVFAFVFFVLSFFVGRAQRLPPNALGVFACVVFFRHFCLLLLVIFLRDVLGSNVAVRGGNLKQKKDWRGGWGGGRSASRPDALGVFACVVFFLSFLSSSSSSSSCVFSSWCSWKQCGSERRQP